MTMNRETAERSTVLRGLVGSTVHGLNVSDGIEDRDEMGVSVEPFEVAMWLRERLYTTVGDVSGQIHLLADRSRFCEWLDRETLANLPKERRFTQLLG